MCEWPKRMCWRTVRVLEMHMALVPVLLRAFLVVTSTT
jgi:hypothetical protein